MEMREVKTADLIGPALDWAVAKAIGLPVFVKTVADQMAELGPDDFTDYEREQLWNIKKPLLRITEIAPHSNACPSYSTDWSQGGPLIGECLTGLARMGGEWCAFALEGKAAQIFAIVEGYFDVDAADADGAGDTELIATCRAVVAAKLGDVVQVPAELLERAA